MCSTICFHPIKHTDKKPPNSDRVASLHVPTKRSQTCNIYLYYYTQHLRKPLLCLPRANALLMIFNDVVLVHGKHLCQSLEHAPLHIIGIVFFLLFPDTPRVVMRIVFIHCTLSWRKVPAGIKGRATGEWARSDIQGEWVVKLSVLPFKVVVDSLLTECLL